MKLLTTIQKTFSEKKQAANFNNSQHLKLLFPEVKEEIVYRKNGKAIDKIIEINTKTGSKIKTTHFDYFDDNKIRSIDEFDYKTGRKMRTINYVLYKSVDEYDVNSGKKIRTINYNIKDEDKISSIQDYDTESGKINTISIYKRDGRTISIIKKIDPETGKITNWVNNRKYKPIDYKQFAPRSNDNIHLVNKQEKDHIDKLIDNLYKHKAELKL